jgi:uncharacterized Zn finger protein
VQDEDSVVEEIAMCPECSNQSEHEVMRRNPKGRGEDALVRCLDCGHVHTLQMRAPRAVHVKTTLSDGNESMLAAIEVDEDEGITVGDVFEHDGMHWCVTRIDDSHSRPVTSLGAVGINAMWAIRRDKAVVKITMNNGETSESARIECKPDRVFSCGSIMSVDGKNWRIRGLHTGRGRTLTGSRTAGEVRRIYLQPPE